ncbi:MAG TPA: hypothetical protein VG122_16680 [Gemmata sp.]|nr:hypothetical protein [Gemmata sp.]
MLQKCGENWLFTSGRIFEHKAAHARVNTKDETTDPGCGDYATDAGGAGWSHQLGQTLTLYRSKAYASLTLIVLWLRSRFAIRGPRQLLYVM